LDLHAAPGLPLTHLTATIFTWLSATAQLVRHALQDPEELLEIITGIMGYAQCHHGLGTSLETAAQSMGFGYVKARHMPSLPSFLVQFVSGYVAHDGVE